MNRNNKIIIFIILLIVLVGSLFYNYQRIKVANQPQFTDDICQKLHLYLYEISNKMQHYYQEKGYYPDDLSILGVYDDSLHYQLTADDVYQLDLSWYDYHISYHSLESPEKLLTKQCLQQMREKDQKR